MGLTEHGDGREDRVVAADVHVHLHGAPPSLSREQRRFADRGTADVRGHLGGSRKRLNSTATTSANSIAGEVRYSSSMIKTKQMTGNAIENFT